MNRTSSICALFLLSAAVNAQVASHARTVPPQQAPKSSSVTVLKPTSKPVARVNGSVLTEADLVREEYAIFPYARQHNGIPKDMAPQIREGAMKMLIFEELVYQEAQRRKMTVAPARMQSAEAQFRKQFTSPAEFNAFLQSDFQGSRDLFLEKVRRSLLIEALLKTEVDSKSGVTPAEVRAYYEKNSARFTRPETYTFQSISIIPPEHASAAQIAEGRKRAEKAYAQAQQSKTSRQFGALAEKMSDDDYRVVLGQHKPVPADQLPMQVKKALQSLQPGAITSIIQVDQAFTILHLQEHAPSGKEKFANVQAQLTKELHESKTNQLRSTLDQKLRKDAKIEML
ncbi:MAG TPA: peptidylprolyl isomerase [Terracidiphilus sp.]|nr:peptidylprolyl isomerase [Terracidiphilus sp.]